jgi:hypothetical protein
MKRQNKLLVPKLDFLWKHVRQKMASIASMGVTVEDFYLLKTNQHVIKLYVQRGKILFGNKHIKRL